MSKRNGKNKSDEAREAAVAQLDEAMDALGGGEAAPEGIEESSPHPSWATLVDPSGASADEEAEYAEAVDEDDDEDEDEDEEGDLRIFDADAEDRAEEFARAQAEAAAGVGAAEVAEEDDGVAPGGRPRELAELVAICEALIFVSDEPITTKTLADVLKEDKGWVQVAVEELAKEFNDRNGGLMLREVAGGWQFATRPEHHEHVRAYLKSKPSAKLSLAALETLAVIAYRQPVTVPEILEIRGVQSSSAIKTLLDKRLIIAKGRKETVGRPMMYGTSKEFLLQFGLRDLSELPNVEDFEDLTGGSGE
ncbi:MAG TPA: SMC-Scp complex subunit ScpB [Pyrinomonadaceae bacterium]|jgi:segregation and condensation protein B|nr:SMC-Scp complex subunit ScpB [Pyrinomonadaceae bacterium]